MYRYCEQSHIIEDWCFNGQIRQRLKMLRSFKFPAYTPDWFHAYYIKGKQDGGQWDLHHLWYPKTRADAAYKYTMLIVQP